MKIKNKIVTALVSVSLSTAAISFVVNPVLNPTVQAAKKKAKPVKHKKVTGVHNKNNSHVNKNLFQKFYSGSNHTPKSHKITHAKQTKKQNHKK